MASKEVLIKQDQDFARRLARRHEGVLHDVDRAYSGPLRRLLRRHLGPALNDHDIDEIVARALAETWHGFKAYSGRSVRSFYFQVGKCRLQDHLRKALRRREAIDEQLPKLASGPEKSEPPPDQALIEQETKLTQSRIMKLIDEAVVLLTDRQRRAFERRFASGGGRAWAKHLEAETGVPAKRWRKASDEARQHVANYLDRRGVHFSKEGGRYEVA